MGIVMWLSLASSGPTTNHLADDDYGGWQNLYRGKYRTPTLCRLFRPVDDVLGRLRISVSEEDLDIVGMGCGRINDHLFHRAGLISTFTGLLWAVLSGASMFASGSGPWLTCNGGLDVPGGTMIMLSAIF